MKILTSVIMIFGIDISKFEVCGRMQLPPIASPGSRPS